MKVRYLLFMLFIMASALNLRANDATWDYNPYAFQYDMSVYVELASVDGKNITDGSDYQIAAFCDEECRGIAEEKAIEDNKYVYLRIRSNKTEGETINFRVKNTTTGKVAKVSETIEFKFQQIVGYPSNPFLINAKNQYNVTLIIDGTENRYSSYYGDQITAPTDLNKEGHTFSKWVPDIDSTVPDHDVTYTATYTINQYTIAFDTDGGSEIAPITQDYNSAVTAPADPTKTGYTFAGWDKEIPATIPAEDITIKALWTINQYTITFDTDGGSEIAPITQDYNSAVTAPADPTKIGYTFAGWDKEIPATIPAEDITIKALWTINQYTITFDTDGGSEIAPITQDYNSAVTAPADPTKTGYTFAGWDKEIPETIPAEDITIKALWTINQYKVTFIADGVIVSEGMYDYGTQIVVPEAPEKEGYTFSTWGEIDATVPDHDVTYTASYDVNYYKLTYILDDEVYAEFDIAFGEFIVPIEVEPEEGRTFEGWQDVPETMPSHDVTIYGRSITTSINSTTIPNNEIVSVYTLKGSLVKKGVEFNSIHKTLESGVYIINGKKVLIK